MHLDKLLLSLLDRILQKMFLSSLYVHTYEVFACCPTVPYFHHKMGWFLNSKYRVPYTTFLKSSEANLLPERLASIENLRLSFFCYI